MVSRPDCLFSHNNIRNVPPIFSEIKKQPVKYTRDHTIMKLYFSCRNMVSGRKGHCIDGIQQVVHPQIEYLGDCAKHTGCH